MNSRVREYLLELGGAMLLGVTLALVMPQAHASLIGTEDAVSSAQAQQERERVQAAIERPEIASKLEKFGISTGDAQARVQAMNDVEVHALAGKLDLLPAGGAVSNTDFLLILIIALLVVVIL